MVGYLFGYYSSRSTKLKKINILLDNDNLLIITYFIFKFILCIIFIILFMLNLDIEFEYSRVYN